MGNLPSHLENFLQEFCDTVVNTSIGLPEELAIENYIINETADTNTNG